MKDEVPIPTSVTIPSDIVAQNLTQEASDNTEKERGDLNAEVGGTSIMAIIMKFLKDPQAFIASLFGKESKDEESENESKWEGLTDSPMFAFFEEMKETFSLTQANTNPDVFNEKHEDPNFPKIMEFLKESGGTYSQESLAILWSNKDSLTIEGTKLMITKESGKLQEIEIQNDDSLAESIIPKESVSDRIPAFTDNLEAAFRGSFRDIPQEYKSEIPAAMAHFETKLQAAVIGGGTPKFTEKQIMHSIEATFSISPLAKPIINNKISTFFASADGKKLKGQYEDLWKA